MIQLEEYTKKRKTRLIVKKGVENIALKLDDVALIYTESKVVFVIANNEKKYIYDKNLSELEQELDKSIFFRANRQCIVNINYIRGFKAFEKVKLQVDLTFSIIPNKIIVSQETAPQFKKWIHEA
jgi:DNA-binding LytR/AlgR family response regulator